MIRYITQRLLQTVPVLVGLLVLLFVWLRMLPGNPAQALLGETATSEAVARLNAQYGFDKPLLEQFWLYIVRLFSGDFGTSIRTGENVLDSFISRFPATLELAIAALLFAAIVGIPLGYLAARRRGTLFDSIVVGGSLFGVVVPVFFLAYILKFVFALKLGMFPTAGRIDSRIEATHPTRLYVLDGVLTGEWDAALNSLAHLILPAIALGAIPLAMIVRITRASVLETMGEDFVRTATAKGLDRFVISRRHVLRPALLPVVTVFGLQAGALLAGAVLTETVFALNGIGQFLFEAINQLDYPVLQLYILFIAVIYVFVNLLVDITYGYIDPRTRLS
ncbi:ABC transporter permease [Leucobacter insecticola]|uniref:ABC transporter permease n=1 Tax=Leucobacter insecticola TaxID=2714934 RepID=A0A6G8FKL2_9MICO|nr:ABC transporter permease [Leucobacter insecticola]QIM16823.1 ABC transporter permease [Leucobacter insecticola]